jgi:chloride channel 3/4/5
MNCDTGIVADEAEDEVHFHTNYTHGILPASMSTSSLLEDDHHRSEDLYDFSAYMDQVSSTSDTDIDMSTKYS